MSVLNWEQPRPEFRPVSDREAKKAGLPSGTLAQIDPQSGEVCLWRQNEQGKLVAPLLGLKRNLKAKEVLRKMWEQ